MIKVRLKKHLAAGHGPFELDVNFEVSRDEIVTLFGHSGAGKTTILRMIAGLTAPDEGFIEVDGEVWFDSARGVHKPVQQRGVGFVFQDYNLFPNMTVRENLRYAVKDKKDMHLIDSFLDMTHLTELGNHKPHTLSGGQKQRVALLRALLNKPKLFLLDEPFSALDLDLRNKLQDEVISLYRRFRIPVVFVSHDVGEVFKLSHRVFVMKDGEIVKSGQVSEVFDEKYAAGNLTTTGDIISVETDGSSHVAVIQIGKHITRVPVAGEGAKRPDNGDHVLVSTQIFKPASRR